VDDRTQFGDTPSAIEVGNVLEVSGFADAHGVLRATRIEKTQDAFTPGTEIELDLKGSSPLSTTRIKHLCSIRCRSISPPPN
jgi:hypothetical protein